jgi:hypothetical protein
MKLDRASPVPAGKENLKYLQGICLGVDGRNRMFGDVQESERIGR